MAIIINGKDLLIEEVIRVCREGEKVMIAGEAREAMDKARSYVEQKLEEGAVIYGLTTGFGKFANVAISPEETAKLQKNLIISHTCAMGDAYPVEYVRAAMLLRCNNLCRGYSGIRCSTVQTMVDMLNAGIHPIVPEKGSVGSSGDLAPLSCIALGLIGAALALVVALTLRDAFPVQAGSNVSIHNEQGLPDWKLIYRHLSSVFAGVLTAIAAGLNHTACRNQRIRRENEQYESVYDLGGDPLFADMDKPKLKRSQKDALRKEKN